MGRFTVTLAVVLAGVPLLITISTVEPESASESPTGF